MLNGRPIDPTRHRRMEGLIDPSRVPAKKNCFLLRIPSCEKLARSRILTGLLPCKGHDRQYDRRP
jgi:hypothetical protein